MYSASTLLGSQLHRTLTKYQKNKALNIHVCAKNLQTCVNTLQIKIFTWRFAVTLLKRMKRKSG